MVAPEKFPQGAHHPHIKIRPFSRRAGAANETCVFFATLYTIFRVYIASAKDASDNFRVVRGNETYDDIFFELQEASGLLAPSMIQSTSNRGKN